MSFSCFKIAQHTSAFQPTALQIGLKQTSDFSCEKVYQNIFFDLPKNLFNFVKKFISCSPLQKKTT